jgi:UDP-N-acetylglucosamine acyltransferase
MTHPTSFVGKNVVLGENCIIEGNCYIEGNITIGSNNRIGRNVIIENDVVIGDSNVISHGVCIGQEPQHARSRRNKDGKVIIGSQNTLREYCTVHSPTGLETKIGNGCYIMNHINVGHDVILDDFVIISNGAQIGGHCYIGKLANIGMNSCVHQNVKIGGFSMIGMGTSVRSDVLPFTVIKDDKSGFNMIGFSRNKDLINVSSSIVLDFFRKCQNGNASIDECPQGLREIYEKFLYNSASSSKI